MAQAGLIDVMDAMAAQITSALSVLSADNIDVQIVPRLVVNPTPPTVDIYPGSLSRETDSAGMGDVFGGYLLTVRARVATADNEAGQTLLLRFMDDTDALCLAAALTDDPTLNGNASSVSARDPSGYTLFPDPGGEGALLGFSFTAVVLPANS
jgi:hypothetical protein